MNLVIYCFTSLLQIQRQCIPILNKETIFILVIAKKTHPFLDFNTYSRIDKKPTELLEVSSFILLRTTIYYNYGL